MSAVHVSRYIQEQLERFSDELDLIGFVNSTNGAAITAVIEGGSNTVAFYVINKAWEADKIKAILTENTADGIATLFVVDNRILPEKNNGNTTSKWEDWLAALHAVSYGRVYAYSPEDNWAIRPYHYEPIEAGRRRLVIGDVVDFSGIATGVITSTAKVFKTSLGEENPTFSFVHFSEGPYWKRQQEEAERKAREEVAKRRKEAEERVRGGQGDNFGRSAGGFGDFSENPNSMGYEEFMEWLKKNSGFGGFGREYSYGNSDANSKGDSGTRRAQEEANRRRQEEANRRNREYWQGSYRSSGSSSSGFASSSHYNTLGIAASATEEEVKKAYRIMMKKWHPDANPDKKEEATKKSQEINAAYSAIKKARGWK